jgi:hypothetical protein
VSEHPSVHYEHADVRPSAVARWGIVLALAVAITGGALIGLIRLLRNMEERGDPPKRPVGDYATSRFPPEPQLQRKPAADLAEDVRKQEQQLDRTGLDTRSGVSYVPIQEAMKALVERQGTPPSPAASPSPRVSTPTDSAPAPTLAHEPGGGR